MILSSLNKEDEENENENKIKSIDANIKVSFA